MDVVCRNVPQKRRVLHCHAHSYEKSSDCAHFRLTCGESFFSSNHLTNVNEKVHFFGRNFIIFVMVSEVNSVKYYSEQLIYISDMLIYINYNILVNKSLHLLSRLPFPCVTE